MKNAVLISLLFLLSLSAKAQKVNLQVIKIRKAAQTEWQILDEQNKVLVSGSNYFSDDSVFFSLEANKKYSLRIFIAEVYKSDTTLYLLFLENEPIILINSDIGPGEYDYPFYSGIKTRDTKITGGVSTDISGFPWQVYFIADNFRCGGTIISPDWVVTAAHCTKRDDGSSIPASLMAVKVGSNNPGNNANLNNTIDGKKYLVSEVIVNEGYNSQTLLNDIALLRINGPINFTNAVPIKMVSASDVADGAIIPGVMSWVTGWGLTSVTPKITPISLQKVQLPIISNLQASAVWGPIPSTDLMAGYLNGNKDACSGDSGGPLVVPVFGEYKLAGIVSWGSLSCNTYGAYTRVSDFDVWIRTKTGIPLAFMPPSPVGDSIICQGVISTAYSISNVPGATSYEWKLFPADAGVISGNSSGASVFWNISKTGSVAVMYRLTINNTISDWSKSDVNIIPNTRLLSQSNDTSLCAGNPVYLTIGAEGYKLTYNWYQDDQLVQWGSSNQISFINSSATNSGTYKVLISGTCGTLYSLPVKLTIHPLTAITHISHDVAVPFGGDVSLIVNAVGHDLLYQWEKDGEYLIGNKDSTMLLQNVNATDIGIYKAIVNGTCGTKTSDKIYVYVKKENSSAQTEVYVWPTIAASSINVALSNSDLYNIRIFNSMGKLMKVQTNCRYQTLVDVSTLARGVYIINIFNSNFNKSIKLFKD